MAEPLRWPYMGPSPAIPCGSARWRASEGRWPAVVCIPMDIPPGDTMLTELRVLLANAITLVLAVADADTA